MTSAQDVETSANVTTNSPPQDYTHLDDHNPLAQTLVLIRFVGESSKHTDNGETVEKQDTVALEDSPTEHGSTSSSGTDTANTPQTVVAANERSLNDALLDNTSVLSSDASLSSMSEMSGNTSFHEASIAFSSTCIKAPSDVTLPSDSTVDFDEGVNDSVGIVQQRNFHQFVEKPMKIITLSNHVTYKEHNEPIGTRSRYQLWFVFLILLLVEENFRVF